MKLILTKNEVLLIQKLLYAYKESLPGDGTERHGRFVGKLCKKVRRQFLNQRNNVLRSEIEGQKDR